MDCSNQAEYFPDYNYDNAVFNPVKDVQTEDASRVLDILDSPDNSDDEGQNPGKDFSLPFALPREKEEMKNIASQILPVVDIQNLPPKLPKQEISSACEAFGRIK